MKKITFLFLLVSLWSCRKEKPSITPTVHRGKVTFKTDSISVPELDTIFFVPIQLTEERDNPVTVYFHINGISATPEEDYFVSNGQLDFPKGTDTLEQFIVINIYPDTETEEDETFSIVIDSSTADIKKDLLVITILDDESRRKTYAGYSTPLEYEGYSLVWQDEFIGTELNEADWNYRIGNGCPNLCGYGNNELQYYTKENAVVSDDLLTITAKEENIGGNAYTSTRINTLGKVSVPFGRIDVRARLPYGKGIWPAIWMMGNDHETTGWPGCGEIDIMELRGSSPKTIGGTLHYKNSVGNHESPQTKYKTLLNGDDYSDEFHVFSMIREEGKVVWLMDGEQFNVAYFSNLNLGAQPNPFLQDFFIILNLAVGGNYDGNPNSSTMFPQLMEIDYVRVFEKE